MYRRIYDTLLVHTDPERAHEIAIEAISRAGSIEAMTDAMVASMKPGSVLIDLAVERGGNVEGARLGEVVTTPEGIRIVGHKNVPGRIAATASQLYAKNLYTFVETLVDKEKKLAVNWDDELVKATALTRDGAVIHPAFLN